MLWFDAGMHAFSQTHQLPIQFILDKLSIYFFWLTRDWTIEINEWSEQLRMVHFKIKHLVETEFKRIWSQFVFVTLQVNTSIRHIEHQRSKHAFQLKVKRNDALSVFNVPIKIQKFLCFEKWIWIGDFRFVSFGIKIIKFNNIICHSK